MPRKYIKAILIVLLCLLSTEAEATATAAEKHRILVLHSFHQDHPATKALHNGLEAVLNQSGMNLDVSYEFMDARRHTGPEYERLLTSFLRHKYANKHFDAIVASGNFAYRYLSEYRQGWFGSTPPIFCGVSDRSYARVGFNQAQTTGLTVVLDIAATIEIARRLHPDRKVIYMIIDNNRMKSSIIKNAQDKILSLKDETEYKVVDAPSLAEFAEILKTMPPDALILFLPFARDKGGNYFSLGEVSDMLRQNGRVPAYTLWSENVVDGIIGGKVTDAESQGKEVGRMLLRILRGEQTDKIPIIRGQTNRYVFNYNELKRFGVPLSALPAGSVVLNRPPSFYAINKNIIWAILGSMVALICIIIFLLFNVIRRKRAEKELSLVNISLANESAQRQKLSSRLIDLLEQDRRTLAMELHDHIGQILTTVKLSLATFKQQEPRLEAVNRISTNAEEKLDQVMKDIRHTIQELRPMSLEFGQLASALRSLIAEMEKFGGLKIHFFCEDTLDRISRKKQLALFRIIQEALHNAIKHSGARNVHVSLLRKGNELSLSVEDDGGGFNYDMATGESRDMGSFGLVLMRERAIQAGGEYHIDSCIGRGTNIMVRMPTD